MSFLIDSVIAGTTIPLPIYVATATTLTGVANGPLPVQDGVTLALNDTLLVISETAANQANCGGYVLTQLGSLSGSPWVLTRMADSNTGSSLQNAAYLVKSGNTLASHLYFVNASSITLGTTPISFINVGATYFSNSFLGAGTVADPVDLSGSVVKGVVLNLPGATVDFTTSGGMATGTAKDAGQTTLIAGTKTIIIPGLTPASVALVTMVSPSGASLTKQYQAVCTGNALTIQANLSAGTINTADNSTLNYLVIK
jgi:hypothetical protein